MNYYAVTAFFNGLFGLFVVYYVFLRNPKNPLNQSFALFGLAVAGWSLIYGFWCWADNPLEAERYVRAHMSFCSMIPATFFHFSCVFTKNEIRLNRGIILNYVLNVAFAVICQTPLMISGVKQMLIFPYWPKPGVLMPFFVIYFSCLVLYCFYLMALFARKSTGSERTHTLIILTGFVVGFSGGWTNWFLWFGIPVEPMANFFVGLLFATMLYVIVRYGVMDRDMLVELIRNNRLAHMGLLMAGINHEIRGPLYVIRGLADIELAEESSSSQELKAICLKTRQQIDRINSIMQKFSLLVRVPPNSPVSASAFLPAIFNNVEALVRAQFVMDQIKITFHASDDLPLVVMDRIHLEEVILNLVMNAAQAIQERKLLQSKYYESFINVWASLNADYVEICVEDNGSGVKDLKSLFQVFSTTKVDGTGLGLYITKQLVEKYKGRVDVKSEIGIGTTFTVKILAQKPVKA